MATVMYKLEWLQYHTDHSDAYIMHQIGGSPRYRATDDKIKHFKFQHNNNIDLNSSEHVAAMANNVHIACKVSQHDEFSTL